MKKSLNLNLNLDTSSQQASALLLVDRPVETAAIITRDTPSQLPLPGPVASPVSPMETKLFLGNKGTNRLDQRKRYAPNTSLLQIFRPLDACL
jgi:hypothetical protein